MRTVPAGGRASYRKAAGAEAGLATGVPPSSAVAETVGRLMQQGAHVRRCIAKTGEARHEDAIEVDPVVGIVGAFRNRNLQRLDECLGVPETLALGKLRHRLGLVYLIGNLDEAVLVISLFASKGLELTAAVLLSSADYSRPLRRLASSPTFGGD